MVASPRRNGLSPRHQDDDIEDDVSVGLQVQQFLDEWHFRVLHSGLASHWDRPEALIKAMEIFEAAGMKITQEEKEFLSELDEGHMIEGLVDRMPKAMKKTIEHFLLQLQLVLSTATRVRNALEEGSADEIAKIMEDGDTGITQQILKEVIIEAGREVGENQEVSNSWGTSMQLRCARLLRCQDDAELAAIELVKVQEDIEIFGSKQNEKTKSVMEHMISDQTMGMLTTAFGAWTSYMATYKAEKNIHLRFQAEVEAAEVRLLTLKDSQVSNLRVFLNRRADDAQETLVKEVFFEWTHILENEKQEREIQVHIKSAQAKLDGVKQSAKDNALSAMKRMLASNDEGLMGMCWGSWVTFIAEYRQNKQYEDAVKASEKQMQDFMKRKVQDAHGVLQRMTGATDSGLVSQAFGAWAEEWRTEKRSREMEEMVVAQEKKFKSLNMRQKGAADGTARRTTRAMDDILMMQIFMDWYTEVRTAQVDRHYRGKMHNKEEKFEAVQSMIKSFATQLEQGIGSSPRSQRKSQGHGRSHRSSSGEGSASRPPQPSSSGGAA
jgi:hypothetical protein